MTYWRNKVASAQRREIWAPSFIAGMSRRLRAQEHTDACKLRVEEFFAQAMGMTVLQWREVEYAHRTGPRVDGVAA